MHKILLLFAAVVMCAATATAQDVLGEGDLKRLEKADAKVANAKLSAKADTWLNHGKEYSLAFQKSHNTEYATTALCSLARAYELDNDIKAEAEAYLSIIINVLDSRCSELSHDKRYMDTAECYELLHKCWSSPVAEEQAAEYFATFTLAQAGLYYGIASEQSEHKDVLLSKAESLISKALDMGYKDNGEIFINLFSCYYAHKFANETKYLDLAKQTLLRGLEQHPANVSIIECLAELYSVEKVGDIEEVVILVNEALIAEPNSYELWYQSGVLYGALGEYDEAISSLERCVELHPDSFEANYGVACFIIEKANRMLTQLNEQIYDYRIDYKAELADINKVYAEALPYLEHAHNLNPDDKATIEDLGALRERLK